MVPFKRLWVIVRYCLSWNVLNSDFSFLCSINPQVPFINKLQRKNINFPREKEGYCLDPWSGNGFNGCLLKLRFFKILSMNVYLKDKDNLAYKINQLLDYPSPVWILLFPEGTRFSQEKFAASQKFAAARGLPELQHHLIPRTKGFSFTGKQSYHMLNPGRILINEPQKFRKKKYFNGKIKIFFL